MKVNYLVCFLVVLGACGGEESGSALEGFYRVGTWTANSTCASEGVSIAATQEPLFYLKLEDGLGARFLSFRGCSTDAECRELASDETEIHLGAFTFHDGTDASGWRAHTPSSSVIAGMCHGSVLDVLLTTTASGVRVESRTVDIAPFTPTGTECPAAQVEEAARGRACTQFEVVTGTNTGSL